MTSDYPIPAKEDVMKHAQKRANETREPYGVWEHVGNANHPWGNIEARHTFRTQPLGKRDPDDCWALVATCDPQ